jgi:TolB-like protein
MSTSPIRNLIENLNRASVWQVFVAYIGFGWLVLEVAEHLVGQWGLPDQAYRVAVTLLLIGLPGVLGTAYVQRRRLHASAQAPPSSGEGNALFPPLVSLATAVAAGGRLGRFLSWRNTIIGSVGALALWGLFAAFWVLTHPGFTPGPAVGAANFASILPPVTREYRAGVGVLMFRDFSPDSAYTHLAEGLTDELIHALNHIEGLKVPSFTSMVALRNSELTSPEIARRLGVGHILEGSVQDQGDRLRVLVQLIDATVDSHEWSLEFDGVVTEPLTLRERIAETVIDSLLAHLPVLERGTASESVRESPAHGAYLAGKSALSERTSAGIRRALLSFQEAIELDSMYAPAYAGLASAYGLSITYRTRLPLNAYSAAGYAMRISRRGIELAPDLAEAYAAHGYVSSLSFAPTEAVLADFGRAFQLEPDAPEVPG